MNTLSDIAGRAGKFAARIGEGARNHLPGKALDWVETGAALGAMRTGTRVATRFVRRNPVVAVAAVAGAGLLWYAARQRARKTTDAEPIEGAARRVEAKRGADTHRRSGKRAASVD